MLPIVTLEWAEKGREMTSYGPRGVRYAVRLEGDAYVCWIHTLEDPPGRKIGAASSKEGAMELAQRDVMRRTEQIAAEEEIKTG